MESLRLVILGLACTRTCSECPEDPAIRGRRSMRLDGWSGPPSLLDALLPVAALALLLLKPSAGADNERIGILLPVFAFLIGSLVVQLTLGGMRVSVGEAVGVVMTGPVTGGFSLGHRSKGQQQGRRYGARKSRVHGYLR